MKSEKLNIRFTGQEHQIDANTLINTLIHYNNLVTQINELYGDGDRDISLKVNALEKGSFEIDITLIQTLRDTLFSGQTAHYLASIATLTGCVYKVYKKYKGRPVKEDEDISDVVNNLTRGNVNQAQIINIYNNCTVRSSISKSIETANEDEAIEGIELSTGGKELFTSLSKSEFSDLIYDDFDKESGINKERIKHDIIDGAILSILVVSFDHKNKWRFIYNGIKLPAMNMKDAGLQKEINNGKSFAKGDAISVKLEITKEFNPSYNAYVNKKYRILEVLKHIPRSRQSDFFDQSE